MNSPNSDNIPGMDTNNYKKPAIDTKPEEQKKEFEKTKSINYWRK